MSQAWKGEDMMLFQAFFDVIVHVSVLCLQGQLKQSVGLAVGFWGPFLKGEHEGVSPLQAHHIASLVPLIQAYPKEMLPPNMDQGHLIDMRPEHFGELAFLNLEKKAKQPKELKFVEEGVALLQ